MSWSGQLQGLRAIATGTRLWPIAKLIVLFLVRPILFSFLKSKAVKLLVLDLLQAYAKSTDNTIDDQVCEYVSKNLFPQDRVEK